MKVGDLVLCPPTLSSEKDSGGWELALVAMLYANEPRIGVVYLNENYQATEAIDVWYAHEIVLISGG